MLSKTSVAIHITGTVEAVPHNQVSVTDWFKILIQDGRGQCGLADDKISVTHEIHLRIKETLSNATSRLLCLD